MSWKKERDSLIAQTMAFVQSVAGRKEEAGPASARSTPAPHPPEPLPPAALEPRETAKSSAVAEPIKTAGPPPIAPAVPRQAVAGEMANEIRARIAGFRAHQERFSREREEYFSQTLAKLKAQIKEMPPRPDKE